MDKEPVYIYTKLTASHDAPLAAIILANLKRFHLDIPGTAYYDKSLDRLSTFYDCPGRYYLVLLREGRVMGGVGLAECEAFSDPACCELQKLYLADEAKGQGISYELMQRIEEKARETGYKRMYLETHTNLQAAIHLYERCGYRETERPEGVVHSTMNRFYIKEL